jgi:Ala-tRNA(Pro) deacylase
MAIAHRVENYMMQYGVQYDVITHPHSHSSMETAELAHVPGDRLAKSVVLEDEDGFLMAVLPSTRHVRLGQLSREMNRRFRLATEEEIGALFEDCERGAIPPSVPPTVCTPSSTTAWPSSRRSISRLVTTSG